MRRSHFTLTLLSATFAALLPLLSSSTYTVVVPDEKNRAYLGYDLNEYPGDAALPVLRKTFSFTSYWLGPPPGEKQTTWLGKRALLRAQGFGFVVLFNGPDIRTLKNESMARQKGIAEGERAAALARKEGFAKGTVVFLDIEEGGRLPGSYHQYLKSWTEALARGGYRSGVYCSGIPVSEGKGVSITTAKDIREHAGAREIVFWVYNDVCPPSPGCTFPASAPSPAESGFSSAMVWQYAQSPRRKEFTAQCPANYAADENCYAPGDSGHRWFLDVNTASSADPSAAK
jgi:hypothetical protein